jgi:hypothetical protein
MSPFPFPDQIRQESSARTHPTTRIGSNRAIIGTIKLKTFQYTLLLGTFAGLIFSLVLWGYESILFLLAHVAYPWISFLVGTISCVLVCVVAALLTRLINRALLGVAFWVLAARLIAEMAIYIPIRIGPSLMVFFEPGLRTHLPAYPIRDAFQIWAGLDTIWLAIFLGILGLLQLTLVETAVPATHAAGRLTPYFIFIPVILLASVMSGNVVNEQFRAPLLATNNLIQFSIDNQNVKVDSDIARQMHMSSLNTISDLISRPRRLFLGQYDESFGQVDILIDFNGEWADCTAINAAPVFCKHLTNK